VLVLTDAAGQDEVARRVPDGWEALLVPIDLDGALIEESGAVPDGGFAVR
jgi:hypothetical protein